MATVDGTNDGDTLYGTGESDLIRGFGGHDVLKGFGGADRLEGGSGIDSAHYEDFAAGVAVNLETGRGFGGSAEGDTLFDIEYLWGSDFNDTLTGNAGGNDLFGLGGADILKGGGGADGLDSGPGDDILKGGGGADYLEGDTGNDTADYSAAPDYVTADLRMAPGVGGISAGEAIGDTFLNIENLVGSPFDDGLFGTDGDNALRGMDGDDYLLGLGGNDRLEGGNSGDAQDVLDGGIGADTMIGGAGNDYYRVDDVGDVLTEIAGEGLDQVQSDISHTLGANFENLFLRFGPTNGIGNNLDNYISGTSGANVLNGSGGADQLVGLLGDDNYIVDNAGDIVNEGGQAGGTDTVRASISFSLAVSATVQGTLENFVLFGTGNVRATGNSIGNRLVGNSGNNILDGAAGTDTMLGGVGNDQYIVDNAGDFTSETGGGGTDTVRASVTRTLGTDIENLVLTGAGNINGAGNALANRIAGNAGDNTLSGLQGNDLFNGGGGADRFIFSTALSAATNVDTIQAFDIANDLIGLENAVFTGIGATLDADEFVAAATAQDAQDRIVYNAANGALFFDADGVGGAAGVRFATLTGSPTISHLDFQMV